MFEQVFKNIDDVLRKEAGCTTELDYTEQTSWLLFLKYLEGLEEERATDAKLNGKKYSPILDKPYRWDTWAAPKTPGSQNGHGQIDHNKAATGDDLTAFVYNKLFPHLHGFKQRASGPNTIEYKIGEIFGEIKNKIQSGYNLREIIDHIDELRFRSQTEKHELSHLYEAKIRNMGNAGRNGGEYYTPRPLIRAIIQVVKPRIGDRVYDGACGSAGFLCESFEYLKAGNANLPIGASKSSPSNNGAKQLTTKDFKTLQERTFFGKEKKSLAYVIAIMNMILHGIEAPNVLHTNTLTENINDIQEKNRFEVVLANPPFGGSERKEIQQNFNIKTGETAFLFLQHFIKILKAGGRAGIVIKNTFLSNTDNASVSLRKLLLESCNLHTILDNPGGVFQGAGVKTVVLFFEKGAPTHKIWYYQLEPGRNLGKGDPLDDEDLQEFIRLQTTLADSPKSWTVEVKKLDGKSLDLSARNPQSRRKTTLRSPREIMQAIEGIDAKSKQEEQIIRERVESYLNAVFSIRDEGWTEKPISDLAQHSLGKMLDQVKNRGELKPYLRNLNVRWFGFDLSDLLEMRFTPNESEKYTAVRGDVLVCEGGYPGRAAIWNEDYPMYFQKALHRVRFHEPLHSKWFVYYLYFLDSTGRLRHNFTGAGIQHFTGEALARFRLPLAPPEQMKELLSNFDILVEGMQSLETLCKHKLSAVDELRKSLLSEAFHGQL